MGDPILTTEHAPQLVHCDIIDLQNSDARLLVELSGLLHSIAQATGDDTHRDLVQPMGSFGSELGALQTLVSIPPLPEDTRKKHHQLFDQAIKGGLEVLEILKEELQKGETKKTTNKSCERLHS